MKLSKNFELNEFVRSNTANRLGINNLPTSKVIENLLKLCVDILLPIRDAYENPINISSGYRCKELNKAVGGVANSQHLTGLAADIDNGRALNELLWRLIVHLIKSNVIEVGLLIKEKSWIHISLPTEKLSNQIF